MNLKNLIVSGLFISFSTFAACAGTPGETSDVIEGASPDNTSLCMGNSAENQYNMGFGVFPPIDFKVLKKDGTYVINVEDNSGTNFQTFQYDSTPPICIPDTTAAGLAPGSWSNETIYLKPGCIDTNGSGCSISSWQTIDIHGQSKNIIATDLVGNPSVNECIVGPAQIDRNTPSLPNNDLKIQHKGLGMNATPISISPNHPTTFRADDGVLNLLFKTIDPAGDVDSGQSDINFTDEINRQINYDQRIQEITDMIISIAKRQTLANSNKELKSAEILTRKARIESNNIRQNILYKLLDSQLSVPLASYFTKINQVKQSLLAQIEAKSIALNNETDTLQRQILENELQSLESQYDSLHDGKSFFENNVLNSFGTPSPPTLSLSAINTLLSDIQAFVFTINYTDFQTAQDSLGFNSEEEFNNWKSALQTKEDELTKFSQELTELKAVYFSNANTNTLDLNFLENQTLVDNLSYVQPILNFIDITSAQNIANNSFQENFTTYNSCSAIKNVNPSSASDIYLIDIDGPGNLSPFEVYCDMSDNGKILILNHDGEADSFPDPTGSCLNLNESCNLTNFVELNKNNFTWDAINLSWSDCPNAAGTITKSDFEDDNNACLNNEDSLVFSTDLTPWGKSLKFKNDCSYTSGDQTIIASFAMGLGDDHKAHGLVTDEIYLDSDTGLKFNNTGAANHAHPYCETGFGSLWLSGGSDQTYNNSLISGDSIVEFSNRILDTGNGYKAYNPIFTNSFSTWQTTNEIYASSITTKEADIVNLNQQISTFTTAIQSLNIDKAMFIQRRDSGQTNIYETFISKVSITNLDNGNTDDFYNKTINTSSKPNYEWNLNNHKFNGKKIFSTTGNYELQLSIFDFAGNKISSPYFYIKVFTGNIAKNKSTLTSNCHLANLTANALDTCQLDFVFKDAFDNVIDNRNGLFNAFNQDVNGPYSFYDADYKTIIQNGLRFTGGITQNQKYFKIWATNTLGEMGIELTSMFPTMQVYSGIDNSLILSKTGTVQIPFDIKEALIKTNGLADPAAVYTTSYDIDLNFKPWVTTLISDQPNGAVPSNPLQVLLGEVFKIYTDTNATKNNLPTNDLKVFVKGHATGKFVNNPLTQTKTEPRNVYKGYPIDLNTNGVRSFDDTRTTFTVGGGFVDGLSGAMTSRIQYKIDDDGLTRTIEYPGGNMGSSVGGQPLFTIPSHIDMRNDLYGGNEGTIEAIIIGADIEGSLQTDGNNFAIQKNSAQSGDSFALKAGNVSAKDIREDITRASYSLLRGISQSNDSIFNGITFNNKEVKYFKGKTVKLKGQISGVGTLVIEDGNLLIDGDLSYADTDSSLGVILINNTNDSVISTLKGHIFVLPQVQNIIGTFYADGSFTSTTDGTNPQITDTLARDDQSIFGKQLLLEGTLLTNNTLGGSMIVNDDDMYNLPQSEATRSEEIAQRYDLHLVRRYRPHMDEHGTLTEDSNLCVKDHYNNCDVNRHAFVVRPDGKVSNQTPPGFNILK